MKTTLVFAVLLGFSTILPRKVHASGCMRYDEYELGAPLGTTAVTGSFSCRPLIKGWNRCWFTPENGNLASLMSEKTLADKDLPPTQQPVLVTVFSYEAMNWQSCDGGDPEPPYSKNGEYDYLEYQGTRYSHFTDSNKTSLLTRLNRHSLSCKSSNGESVSLKNENGGIRAEGLCFGGDEIQTEATTNFIVISCGDDGTQNTLIALSVKGVKAGDTVDGSTYFNMSPGYPYVDGQVKYLTCTVI